MKSFTANFARNTAENRKTFTEKLTRHMLFFLILAAFLVLGKGVSASEGGGIRLSSSVLELNVGDSYRLHITEKPAGEAVIWSSSKSSVASVEAGRISAKRAGSAVITAKCGSLVATCQLTIRRSNARVGVYTYDYPATNKDVILQATDIFYVLSRDEGKITFVCEHRGEEGEPILRTKPITVALRGNKTGVFTWEDSCGNVGTGRATFTGIRVSLAFTVLVEEEDSCWNWEEGVFVMTLTDRKISREERKSLLQG